MGDVSINQFNAFGVRVRNVRVAAPHVAQGLVTLLAATRGGASIELVKPSSGAELDRLVDAWKQELGARWGEETFKLPAASPVRALGVASTKHGPLSISEDEQTAYPLDNEKTADLYRRLTERGVEHIKAVLDGGITRAAHLALADVIGIDGRFKVSGAHTPTTPGPALIDYDSNYTLALLHAPTALGLIASVADGERLIQELGATVSDSADPHSQLLHALKLAASPPPLPAVTLPAPTGDQWVAAAAHLTRGVSNLMRWAQTSGGAAPKAELLMSVTDLVCLFFMTRILTWAGDGDPRPGAHALLVAPRGATSADARAVQNAARATLRRAEGRLRQQAKPGPLAEPPEAALRLPEVANRRTKKLGSSCYHRNWAPEVAACALGASAGWLLPVHARGGARRYVSPGSAQLLTLVHSLIEPGEEIPWVRLHERAWEAHRLCLGDVNARDFSAIGIPENVVRLAGALNKEQLIRHGLARREADNVVMVDGGAR